MSDQHDETKPTWTAPAPVAPAAPAPVTTPPAPSGTPAAPLDPAVSGAAAAPATPAAPTSPAAAAVTMPVTPAVAVAPRKRSGAWVNVLLGVAAVIAIGGVAFAIGRSTAPASAATNGRFGSGFANGNGFAVGPGSSFQPGQGVPGRGFFGTGGPTIDGTVESIDATSMTIKLASGDTMTIAFDGSTTYHQSTPATSADVAVGDDVAVRVSGGGRFVIGNGNGAGNGNGNGNGNANGNGPDRDLTASDVTVSK